MPAASPVIFSSGIVGIAALAVALAAIVVAGLRRIPLSPLPAWLLSMGLIFLALAAAGPIWNRPRPGTIAVMVDLSPSTRGANFRRPEFLRGRLRELIGDSPYQLIAFAETNRPLDIAGPFDEISSERTVFTPPDSQAVVLFSDARFDLPEKSPPMFVAVDEGLEDVSDASVKNLEIRGDAVAATFANSGPPREASFLGASVAVGKGTLVVSRLIPSGTSTATVSLNAADLWPENDSLTLAISPPYSSEKWWIGESPAGGGWKSLSPAQLPDSAQEYLAPAVIVIDNEPAERFSPAALDRLLQYVRDLGGSVLILGGEHAFASGDYGGTVLERISPLAGFPPMPTKRWILLVDASGSMSQDVGGGVSRWQAAAQSISRLLPNLPPADLVEIGQFSDAIRWWLPAQSVADAERSPLPPSGEYPHGPTNLEPALDQIVGETDGSFPTELVLVSDCDAEIERPGDLANHLREKHIRLDVLAIGHGTALDAIGTISIATGGKVIDEFDPRKWTESIRSLARSALPRLLMRSPANVFFQKDLKSLPPATTSLWNRIWLKDGAEAWARTGSSSSAIPMAGWWRVGAGKVLATAFEPAASQTEFLASLIAAKPRDPRFSVRWESSSTLHVTVDATNKGKFLNDLPISLDLSNDDATHYFPRRENQREDQRGRESLKSKTPDPFDVPFRQTAPGRYEISIDSPMNSEIAAVRIDGEAIDRRWIAGRYPREFDAVGNDHAAMRRLADITGGEIIPPDDHRRIRFHWPNTAAPLAPWISLVALVFISTALLIDRLRAAIGRHTSA